MNDEEIRRALRRAAPTVSADGARQAIGERRHRYSVRRRVGSTALAVAVVSASVGTFLVLRTSISPGVASGATGVIVFSRVLRACPDYPHVDGPGVKVFAASPDGSQEWNLSQAADIDTDRWGHSQYLAAVAPDGTRFAWNIYQKGLVVSDLLSRTTRRVVAKRFRVSDVAWSPDGQTIVFSATTPYDVPVDSNDEELIAAVTPNIYEISTDGGQPKLLAEQASDPEFSPDGATIAYLNYPALRVELSQNGGVAVVPIESQPEQELWFMDADGSTQRLIRAAPEDADWHVADGEWSPGGDAFAATVRFPGNSDIVVANIQGFTGMRLTEDPADDSSPTWSPDGSTIAFTTGRWGEDVGHSEIATIPSDGGSPYQVTGNCWDDVAPHWIGDDQTILGLREWVPDTDPN